MTYIQPPLVTMPMPELLQRLSLRFKGVDDGQLETLFMWMVVCIKLNWTLINP
jgi:hypothetical protein